jgi:hypothetical protein
MLQISKSKYPLGTKVAKQFHEGKFEGELRGYNAQEDFYFIMYKDGDSEDLDCVEMDQAVQEHPHQVLVMSFQLHLVTVGLRGLVVAAVFNREQLVHQSQQQPTLQHQ